jgi:hypothetical protein
MSVVHVTTPPTLDAGVCASCDADRQPADPIDTWGLLGRPPMYSAVTRREV